MPVLGLSFDDVVTTTRAVRKRLDTTRPVPMSEIMECLEIALQAPSGGNGQGWRWLVVTDETKKAAIAELYRSAALEMFERQAADTTLSPSTRRAYEGAVHLAKTLEDVPVLVIPCALGRIDGADNQRSAGFYGSIVPAVWSFQLALRSRGLGTVYTTAHLKHERELARLLGIPDDVTQVALLPVAYTRGTDFRPAERHPVEAVTYVDTWGAGMQDAGVSEGAQQV